jgi:hypothetical protein
MLIDDLLNLRERRLRNADLVHREGSERVVFDVSREEIGVHVGLERGFGSFELDMGVTVQRDSVREREKTIERPERANRNARLIASSPRQIFGGRRA